MRTTLDKAKKRRAAQPPEELELEALARRIHMLGDDISPAPVGTPTPPDVKEQVSSMLHMIGDESPAPVGTVTPPDVKAQVSNFRALFNELTGFVGDVEDALPVYEFAFDFMEWVLLRYLSENPRKDSAIRQACPVEWAQIDSILRFVKEKMAGIEEKFEEAMEIVENAVSSDDDSETRRALG
ncbi:uncharacterized protein LOC144867961, partial [Branchiostoma floridae x Branchiostoma japonicum]